MATLSEPGASAVADLSDLFDAEQRGALRLATLLVGSVSVAEEVVQDAFASVGERWDEIDRPGAYLRRSVVNGCAMVLRRRETEARYRPLLATPAETELPTRLVELGDALDALTDRQRIAVVLRYFVDIPDAEIADLLEVRPATVRSIIHRALETLRKELS